MSNCYNNDNGNLGSQQRPIFDKAPQAAPAPTGGSARPYSSVIVFKPQAIHEVQKIIDFLRYRESAIVNLDSAHDNVRQRILDYISGAVYALSGQVYRISGNIFLLTPEGVEISAPNNL